MNFLLTACVAALGGFVGGCVACLFFYKIFWEDKVKPADTYKPRRRKYTDIEWRR